MKALAIGSTGREIGECMRALEEIGPDEIYVLSMGRERGVGVAKKTFLSSVGNHYEIFLALEAISEEISPDLIVGPSTRNVIDALALFCGKREMPMITEVNSLKRTEGGIEFVRPLFSGKATVTLLASIPCSFTIAPGVFEARELEEGGEVEKIGIPSPPLEVLKREPKELGGVDLSAADVVIGVGRGFRSKEDLKLARELAELVGGVVGGTRPVVADYKWLPEPYIGISGTRVSPRVYFAVGVSGASQHIMAATSSKLIISVNKDKNAPIFQYSDVGVVADLYEFLPKLLERLKKK